MRVSWRFVVEIVAPAFCVCWIGYFAYGAVLGATGFHTLTKIEADAEVKAAELEALTEQRRRLERVADQLNPKSLDPDMIDEKIRSVLGYVADRDVVIPRDQLEQVLSDIAATGP